jgi:hypothetical protein
MKKAILSFEEVKVSPDFSTNHIDFADDAALLGKSVCEAQTMLRKVPKVVAPVGLKINIDKTKGMSNAPEINSTPITLNHRQLEVVNKWKYIGSYININSKCSGEIQCRIASASTVFPHFWKPLWKKKIHRKAKILIYDALVRSILLYGCKTWPLKVTKAHALNTF